mgnify:CR=1 FL=1
MDAADSLCPWFLSHSDSDSLSDSHSQFLPLPSWKTMTEIQTSPARVDVVLAGLESECGQNRKVL